MRVAITGGTGFVGRHLARLLVSQGHEAVLVSRGVDRRDESVRSSAGMEFKPVGIGDVDALPGAFEGCEAVAHLGGINREIGSQTYEHVHVKGTANVIEAARRAGARKIIFLSFLRARPNCKLAYHESKHAAELLVQKSGLDYTVFKAGVIYGAGDHMLDHISHALHTFPVFLLVGFRSLPVRPLAVEDLVDVMSSSLTEGRLSNKTVPITGPEQMDLREAVARISRVAGKKRLTFSVPVWVHSAMSWFFERTMAVPLAAKAQVRILSESLVEPLLAQDRLPSDLEPQTPFTDEQIRKGLPEPGGFTVRDCLCRAQTQ
ncbi:MAG: NAD(P)H-binding protein [Armatimonadetes bacterium]|nr:NAD(P)H-binding protein [Armatimonadota bacterium]